MKYQFIEEHRDQYPVTLMCRILEVVRSGYYKWRKQPLSARKMADLVLLKQMRDIFEQSRETYGSYRIHAELAERGILVRYYDSPGLTDHLRFSIGTAEQMTRLAEVLRQL